MERLYLFDVREENGLFSYGRDEETAARLREYYEVILPSVEHMGSLDDMVVGILDEEPDLVLIRTADNCGQLDYAVARRLAQEGTGNLWILSGKAEEDGVVWIGGQKCSVVSWPAALPLSRRSEKEYAPEEVFSPEIAYGPGAAQILKNGVEAYVTGSYPDPGRLMNLKHLYFEEAPGQLPEFSDELFDVNSALIYPDYDQDRFRGLKQTENGIYMHVHQMDGETLFLDNNSAGEPVSVMKYSEYSGQLPVFLKIEDRDDIRALLQDVDAFKKTGTTSKMGIRLVNECAWGVSPCILSGLLRGRTDRTRALRPCPGCSRSVGSVEDDSFALARQAAVIMRQEKLSRGCEGCAMAQMCSKCAMLPDGLSAEEYCEAFRYPGTFDFLFKSVIVGGIFGGSRRLHGEDYRMIEISSPYRRLVVTGKELQNVPEKRKRSILVAVKTGKLYYVLGYKASKLYQTDERFVYLSEMFDSDVPVDDIMKLYGKRYRLTREDAGAHVMEAYEMIKDAVII